LLRHLGFGLAALVVAATGAIAAEREPLPPAQLQKALDTLAAEAKQAIADDRTPGIAIAVVHGDAVIFAEGFGVRNVETGEPVDPDTVFQLASVSKPIGSTVISGLIGDGKLSWDTRLMDLTPGFAMQEPWVTSQVTLRDLYAHRSGLPDHAGDLLEDYGYDREAVLHRLRFQPPLTSFRSGYAYTNFGITAAAVAAASTTGVDWETLSEERLYAPLDMASTSSRYADFIDEANRASGHVRVDGKWAFVEQRQPDAQSPAGGVSSSVNDLTRWVRLLVNHGMFEGKQVIAAAPLDEAHLPAMITGYAPNGAPSFYGLGWNVGYGGDARHSISHSGAFAMGAGTTVNISLDDKLGVIVLTNGAPVGVSEALANAFMDNAILGAPRYPWQEVFTGIFAQMAADGISHNFDTPPADAGPAAADAAYAGSFTNDFYGPIEVVAAADGLDLLIGPNRRSFRLTHFDRDTFTFETIGENASGLSGVSFALDGAGKARSVWIEAFDKSGLGTFARTP
jgi:CubicO group peptidase (beta-lactamase class C family)